MSFGVHGFLASYHNLSLCMKQQSRLDMLKAVDGKQHCCHLIQDKMRAEGQIAEMIVEGNSESLQGSGTETLQRLGHAT